MLLATQPGAREFAHYLGAAACAIDLMLTFFPPGGKSMVLAEVSGVQAPQGAGSQNTRRAGSAFCSYP